MGFVLNLIFGTDPLLFQNSKYGVPRLMVSNKTRMLMISSTKKLKFRIGLENRTNVKRVYNKGDLKSSLFNG